MFFWVFLGFFAFFAASRPLHVRQFIDSSSGAGSSSRACNGVVKLLISSHVRITMSTNAVYVRITMSWYIYNDVRKPHVFACSLPVYR